MASTDSTTSGAKRTAVKTQRISPGVYGTLDGSYRTSRNEQGRWVLHNRDGSQVGEADGYRTSDEALTALVDVLEADLTTLNTAPPKPQRNAAKGDAQGRNEPAQAERKPRGRKQPATT
jgi:hypothetical protein